MDMATAHRVPVGAVLALAALSLAGCATAVADEPITAPTVTVTATPVALCDSGTWNIQDEERQTEYSEAWDEYTVDAADYYVDDEFDTDSYLDDGEAMIARLDAFQKTFDSLYPRDINKAACLFATDSLEAAEAYVAEAAS